MRTQAPTRKNQTDSTELLEQLYQRCVELVGTNRTSFPALIGVTYVTYCNWRAGRYPVDQFTRFSVEAHLALGDATLRQLLKARDTK